MIPQAPGRWADHANCRGHLDDMHAPRREDRASTHWPHMLQRAKQYCHTCPVLTECRTWAMTIPDPAVGLVAGGLSPHERELRRRALWARLAGP